MRTRTHSGSRCRFLQPACIGLTRRRTRVRLATVEDIILCCERSAGRTLATQRARTGDSSSRNYIAALGTRRVLLLVIDSLSQGGNFHMTVTLLTLKDKNSSQVDSSRALTMNPCTAPQAFCLQDEVQHRGGPLHRGPPG